MNTIHDTTHQLVSKFSAHRDVWRLVSQLSDLVGGAESALQLLLLLSSAGFGVPSFAQGCFPDASCDASSGA